MRVFGEPPRTETEMERRPRRNGSAAKSEVAMRSDFTLGRQRPAARPHGADGLWTGNDFGHLKAHLAAAEERHRAYMAEAELEHLLAEAGLLPQRRSPAQLLASGIAWLRAQAGVAARRRMAARRPKPGRLPLA
ncbi:MAG TPA: hypothetical protein VFI22_06980 [Thermomicrobiales bacterium]|nr:hypothetical protein [Thermomicrobiales bacterium]